MAVHNSKPTHMLGRKRFASKTSRELARLQHQISLYAQRHNSAVERELLAKSRAVLPTVEPARLPFDTCIDQMMELVERHFAGAVAAD